MKKKLFILAAALMTAAASYAQQFTVKASIPGIPAGCEVRLLARTGRNKELAKSVTSDGGFELKGTIDKPTLVGLRINDKPQYGVDEMPQDRGASFILTEGTTTIQAEDISLVPRNYELGDTPLKKERHVKIVGGPAQQHYQEWRDYILDAELSAWHADHVLWKAQFGGGRLNDTPKGLDEMKTAGQATQEVVNVLTQAFVKAHPDYAISLFLQQEQMENMFVFTHEELDEMLTLFKNNEDQQGYAAFAEQVEQLRKYTKGTPYTDLNLELPDGKQVQLSRYVKKGTITFVDFWASWCGPCRAAIPSVKKMHRQWGDRVNILSISLDTNKEAWQQAMQQEQMPWTQLLVPRESSKALTYAYQVRAIPYLMIIDGNGRILLTTHSADEAQAAIEGRVGLRGER